MLIKITLVAIVIYIALLIISRMYFRTLSTSGKLRFVAGINYRKGEKLFLIVTGITYIVTFALVIASVIYLIFRYV